MCIQRDLIQVFYTAKSLALDGVPFALTEFWMKAFHRVTSLPSPSPQTPLTYVRGGVKGLSRSSPKRKKRAGDVSGMHRQNDESPVVRSTPAPGSTGVQFK